MLQDTPPRKERAMRKRWAVAILAAVGMCLPAAAEACGDKLVVLGRGVRFERIHRATHPGAIVVFLNPDSNLPRAEEEFHLSGSLELAGHTVVEVGSRVELERALQAGATDVIVADLDDATSLWKELDGAGGAPAVIPVLYKPTPQDLEKAERLTTCVGQAGKRKTRNLLAIVDEMVGQHKKGEPAACAPAGEKASS